MQFRPFTTADYAAITRIHNANFAPEFALDNGKLEFEDAHRAAYCRSGRWVAERGGDVVGYGEFSQRESFYDPRKFNIDVAVDPVCFGQGIGRRLYDLVLEALLPAEPLALDTWSREDMACRVGFLERRGFAPDMRMWTSTLDLTTFEPERWASWPARAEVQGIELRSLAELGTGGDVWRREYDLWLAVRDDVPSPPGWERNEVAFERFLEWVQRPNLWPAGYFVALDRGQFVGSSALWPALDEPGTVRTGLTAVRPTHRRRGIAFALKVRALARAKAEGFRQAHTENEINNRGMLAINDALGFVKRPAWLHYTKSFAV